MSSIDDFLSTIDVALQAPSPHQVSAPSVAAEPPAQPSTSSLADSDLEDILSDYGFNREPYEGDEDTEEVETTEETLVVDEEPETTEPISETPAEPVIAETTGEVILTQNSPTLLMDDSTSRFSGTEWYNEIQSKRIVLAGLGGIGSWTALQLARMHPEKLTIYDADTVEIANMSGQLYASSQVGKTKAAAVYETIRNFTTTGSVFSIPGNFLSGSTPGDIMICGFDSMSARKTFFNSWKQHLQQLPDEERKKCLFIDGRLSIDTAQVLCVQGDDTYNIDRYEKEFLFSTYEAESTVCSMKQTTYLACMIGSFIVNIFTNWVAQSLNPIIPYDVPFFTEYSSQSMIFKTEN